MPIFGNHNVEHGYIYALNEAPQLRDTQRIRLKIEAITLREIHMPLVHFFETSFGRTTGRRIILVTVHAEGVEGWGECVAGEHPFYSPEDVDTAWHTLANYFAPSLIGNPP